MDIRRRQCDGFLELLFEGRLDAYWAQHLVASVAEIMREGTHHLRLNLSQASYISSAGIGVLVRMYKEFGAVGGSFAVTEPSRQVKHVLDMVGLANMLLGAKAPEAAPPPAPAPAPPVPEIEHLESGGAVFEIHTCSAGAELTCALVGDPARLSNGGYSSDDSHTMFLTENRLALGLGAFGENCKGRFGEFLSVAGAAACQPTDGSNYADHMLASGSFVPHLSALYGLSCDGPFRKLLRFESASGNDPVALSSVAGSCLESVDAGTAAIAIVAESAGLMGATLKQSPVQKGDASRIFDFPEVRRWLSFSPERCFAHALVLIVGIVSKSPPAELQPFVRPMGKGAALSGHFHAAAFAYRPLQKGKVDLRAAVQSLFDAGGLLGVLHLLSDDREIAGAGESELLRGACWVGPIRNVGVAKPEAAA